MAETCGFRPARPECRASNDSYEHRIYYTQIAYPPKIKFRDSRTDEKSGRDMTVSNLSKIGYVDARAERVLSARAKLDARSTVSAG